MAQDLVMQDNVRPLTFEALLADPLTRLLMDADRVTVDDMVTVMQAARAARHCSVRPGPPAGGATPFGISRRRP